ncbi:MAG: hypothetical protein CMI54_02540 [Parcubacteria group bacterium]|nr:hypothetical protein [Parcubacteria group bacterium]|tara:strand:+ start:4100 stop:4375 length:276 start_codon:yes stop_codon:yes gene_type:complete
MIIKRFDAAKYHKKGFPHEHFFSGKRVARMKYFQNNPKHEPSREEIETALTEFLEKGGEIEKSHPPNDMPMMVKDRCIGYKKHSKLTGKNW